MAVGLSQRFWATQIHSNENSIDHFAPEMTNGDMGFLDTSSTLGGDDNCQIATGSQWLAGDARQSDRLATNGPGAFCCPDNVFRLTAGANRNQKIAGGGQRFDLPRENLFVPEIIADSSQGGSVCGEGNRGKRAPRLFIASHQLGGNVLRIGGTAAIPAKQDLLSGLERLADEATGLFDLAELGVDQNLDGSQMFGE